MSWEEFDERCRQVAKLIMEDKSIKNLFGLPRSGLIPAVRISYLTGLPLTTNPKSKETAIIDDCIETGTTEHSFSNFLHFYVLVDKREEDVEGYIEMPWEKK